MIHRRFIVRSDKQTNWLITLNRHSSLCHTIQSMREAIDGRKVDGGGVRQERVESTSRSSGLLLAQLDRGELDDRAQEGRLTGTVPSAENETAGVWPASRRCHMVLYGYRQHGPDYSPRALGEQSGPSSVMLSSYLSWEVSQPLAACLCLRPSSVSPSSFSRSQPGICSAPD